MKLHWSRWVLGGITGLALVQLMRNPSRENGKKAELQENLTRWEGEGGNVPQPERANVEFSEHRAPVRSFAH